MNKCGLAAGSDYCDERTHQRTTQNDRTNEKHTDECIFPKLDKLYSHLPDDIKQHCGESQHPQHHRASDSARPD